MRKYKSPEHPGKIYPYLLINGITAVAILIGAITIIITGHPIIAGIALFILALIPAASCYAVYKRGSKAIPPQVIFPTVRMDSNSNLDRRSTIHPQSKLRKSHRH
jgi:hypothetical protein